MSEHANVTTFLACERIIEEKVTNKKTVVGIFKNFSFQKLPARHNFQWFILAQIINLDSVRTDITVNIVHDQTQAVVFGARMEIPEKHPESIDLVLEATTTEFPKEGKYVVTININGFQSAYFVLNVELRKQQIVGG